MADYKVEGSGTVYLLRPLNISAAENLKEHTNEEAQFFGNALAVEHRYIDDLVAQLREEGWEVE